jgi:hypothetical protein
MLCFTHDRLSVDSTLCQSGLKSNVVLTSATLTVCQTAPIHWDFLLGELHSAEFRLSISVQFLISSFCRLKFETVRGNELSSGAGRVRWAPPCRLPAVPFLCSPLNQRGTGVAVSCACGLTSALTRSGHGKVTTGSSRLAECPTWVSNRHVSRTATEEAARTRARRPCESITTATFLTTTTLSPV